MEGWVIFRFFPEVGRCGCQNDGCEEADTTVMIVAKEGGLTLTASSRARGMEPAEVLP